MKDRKTFLAALGVTGAALAVGTRGAANPAPPSDVPTAFAKPSAAPPARKAPPIEKRGRRKAKSPSAGALAAAAAFRRFDARLSDTEIETIARGIDDGYKSGATLSPKKKPLHNWNEPVTTFTVPA